MSIGRIIAIVILTAELLQGTAHAAAKAPEFEISDSAAPREQVLPQIVQCIEILNGHNPADGANPVCPQVGPISFGIARDKPSADWTAALRALGRSLRQPGMRRLRIRIIGHASCQESARGDPELMALSLKRAKRVRDLLAHEGDLDDDRIDVEGRGRTDPIEKDAAGIRATSPLAADCGTGSLASSVESQRVEFEIATSLGLAYGEIAYNQQASPLAGTDPLPPANIDPAAHAAVGAAAREQYLAQHRANWDTLSPAQRRRLEAEAIVAARTAMAEALRDAGGARGTASKQRQVIRYFPQGLRPAGYYTIDLGKASAMLVPRVRGAQAGGCGGYRSRWLNLQPLSNLDKAAGELSVRFRTVRIRTDRNRVDGARLFADLRGRASSAPFATPATAPAHWALRERLATVLRQTMLGGTVPAEIEAVDGGSAEAAGFVAACRLTIANEDQEVAVQSAFDAVIGAAPATTEDLLGRALELNSKGFIRLSAGLQLCVRSAQTATRANSSQIRFELAFGGGECAILRRFPFDSGREGLTAIDPDLWRYRAPDTENRIPYVRKPVDTSDPDDHGSDSEEYDAEQIVVTRWADLVDVGQSGPAYLVRATGPSASWVGAPWATDRENASFIIGIRAAEPLSMNAGPLILNQFYRSLQQACRRGGDDFTLPDGARDRTPGAYLRLKELPKLADLARTTAVRCATAERMADLFVNLPVRVGDQTQYLPVGATWGELASGTVAPDRALYRAAAQSLAVRLLFGADASDALLTASALGRLPLLPGDVARW